MQADPASAGIADGDEESAMALGNVQVTTEVTTENSPVCSRKKLFSGVCAAAFFVMAAVGIDLALIAPNVNPTTTKVQAIELWLDQVELIGPKSVCRCYFEMPGAECGGVKAQRAAAHSESFRAAVTYPAAKPCMQF